MHDSPYRRLNLTRNPFGELTAEERAELAVVDVARWLPALQTSRSALQFLGPCGHGKTTHLLALHRMLPSSQYVYLPEEKPHPHVPTARPLLLDELQRLSRWGRRRLYRAGGPLVLGTHEDYADELRRAGFDVQTYHVASEHSPQRLQQMFNQRIEASRWSAGDVPRIDTGTAVRLCERFGADIRAMEHHLYHQFQQLIQETPPWPLAN